MHRHITTSFIFFSDTEFLLLKRAPEVRTYPEKWAAVSGSVEDGETYLECAKREIGEETQIKDLYCVREGRPLIVDTRPKYDRVYNIHCFMFKTGCSLNDVVLDWEHTTCKLVNFETLKTHPDVVPQLIDGYIRVAGVPSAIEQSLNRIKNNTSDGAAEITMQAVADVLAVLEMESFDRETWYNLAWHYYNIRSVMCSIGNAIVRIVTAQEMAHEAKVILDEISEANNAIGRQLASFLSENSVIMTLSYSSTVLNALIQCKPAHVIVLESKPQCEGRRLAEKLQSHDITTTVIHDNNIMVAARHYSVDCMVIGADTVRANGAIVNKVGSELLCMAASALNVPFYVLAWSLKIQGETYIDQPLGTVFEVFSGETTILTENGEVDLERYGKDISERNHRIGLYE